MPTPPTRATSAAILRPMAALEIWKMPERLERSLRGLVGDYAFDVDSLGHRLHLPERLSHNVCLAADVTVGWGPDASDWETAKTPFLRWFYRWYWDGRCPTCAGEKTIQIWRKGDATSDFHEETCPGCQGSGQMAADLATASA
jgi:hypothetical protein